MFKKLTPHLAIFSIIMFGIFLYYVIVSNLHTLGFTSEHTDGILRKIHLSLYILWGIFMTVYMIVLVIPDKKNKQ